MRELHSLSPVKSQNIFGVTRKPQESTKRNISVKIIILFNVLYISVLIPYQLYNSC